MAEALERVSLSLTHVQYVKGDVIGQLIAWSSLFPIFLLVSFLTLIVFRRDLQTIAFFLGLLINEVFNVILKHIIKEPRPESDLYKPSLFMEYGMPSSHAQFMGFFAMYFTLLVFVRTVLSEGGKDYFFKGVCSFGAIMGASLCSVSRVYLSYHTVSQVLSGAVLGGLMGITWFAIVQFVFAPEFPRIYYWKISDRLLLRDVSLIPNYLWYEYTAARRETLNRLKRKSG